MNFHGRAKLLIFMLSPLYLQGMESYAPDMLSSHDNSIKELGNEDSIHATAFPLRNENKDFRRYD